MVEPITLEEVEKIEEKKKAKKKGQRKQEENKVDIVEEALKAKGFNFVFNELSREIEIMSEDGKSEPMTDYIFAGILVELWRSGYNISKPFLETVIMGSMSEPYHPIADYFDSLPAWKGYDEIAKLAGMVEIKDLPGLNLKTKWPEYLKKWLVAAAAQATIKEASNHACLVLIGEQGKGKTTFLEYLCPPELSHLSFTGHIRIGDKDTDNLLAERFIINIDDQLDNMGDLKKLKSMFTVNKVVNRKAYAKFQPTRPRVASFVASVNSEEFLTDDANRRYLAFTINDINLNGLKSIDQSQLWAQVAHLLKNGFRYWFSKEENVVISNTNEAFRVKTEEEEMLSIYFSSDSNGEPWQQTEILNFLASRTNSKLNAKKLTTALKKLGFEKKSARGVGGREYPVYVYMVSKIEDYDQERNRKDLKKQLAGSDNEPWPPK